MADYYVGYPRNFRSGDTTYDDYSEYFVERALIHAGFKVVSKNAYYFHGNSCRQNLAQEDQETWTTLPIIRLGIAIWASR